MWTRYSLALVVLAAAIGGRFLLDPWLGDRLGFVTLFGGVAVVVWFGGWKPALVTTVLGFFAVNFLLVTPRYEVSLQSSYIWAGLIGYAVSCGAIIYLGESMRRVMRQAQERGRQLEQEMASRAKVEEALRASEGQLQFAMRAGRMGLWDWNISTGEVTWSPGHYELLGLKPGEVKPSFEAWAERVHPEDFAKTENILRHAMAARLPYEADFRVKHPDGTTHWIGARGQFTYDDQGKCVRMVGVMIDIAGRKSAEEALRGSREQMALISDTVPALISYVDSNCCYQFCNRAYTEWFGAPREKLLGRSMREVLGELAWKALEPHIRTALSGKTADFETEARYSTGGTRWIHAVYTPHRDNQGNVVGLVILVSDISERKRSEEALRESEQRFRAVADAAPVLVWMAAADKSCLWFNRGWLNFVGRAMEQEIGNGWTENIHPDDLARCMKVYRDSFDERHAFEMEYRMRHFTGQYRWILNRGVPRYTPDGTFEGYIGACIDVHELKESADAVRQAAERFRSLVSVITDLPWSTNAEGAFVTPQAAWEKYTGQTRDQYHDFGWANALHPDDRQKVMQAWTAARQNRSLYEVQARLWHAPTQQWRHCSARATPLLGPNGTVTEWVGACTDVDEQRRTEEKLERMVEERTARLREMVGELEAFSYSIAHDMRAPLRAMQGFSDILMTEYAPQLDSTGQNFLRRIEASANRMDNLIQDVLNYSRVIRADLPMEPVALGPLVEGIIETYPALTSDKADITLSGELPIVLGNQAMLTQIFSNLLGNAVKFVAEGVKPVVRVRAEDAPARPRPNLPAGQKNIALNPKRVRVWVEDNGIGIAEEHRDRIFAIFQRVGRNYEGTGIGLAIVKKAMERMGGKVGVQSELGKGSRFWIELEKA